MATKGVARGQPPVPGAVKRHGEWFAEEACPGCGKRRYVPMRKSGRNCRLCAGTGDAGSADGLAHTPLDKVWQTMMARCGYLPGGDPRTRDRYVGNGIEVCEEWRASKVAFFRWALANGYRKGLWLDRVKNALGYSPDNCRFVTPAGSARNRSSTRFDEAQVAGIKRRLCAGEFCRVIAAEFDVSVGTIGDIRTGKTWAEVEPSTLHLPPRVGSAGRSRR